MDEILKKLVESEILTEATKEEITTKLQEAIDSKIEEGVKLASKIEKEKLREQFDAEREKIVEGIDKFLSKNMKGALAESVRNELKAEYELDKKNIIESISTFLEVQLEDVKPVKESKEDVSAKAFYTLAKELFINEQEVDEKAATVIKKLKESLKESKAENSKLYGKLVEAKKKDEARILEGKVSETLRLIPESKRAVAKRLLEGVSLSAFDKTAKAVVDELVESEVSDETPTDKKHTERVVESVEPVKKEFDEDAYLASLGG